MSTSVKNYDQEFNKFMTDFRDKEISPCQKLDNLRELTVRLTQLRGTYWTKPCFKNWYCAFDQDHSNIDALKERMHAIEHSLLRQCESQIYRDRMEAASKMSQTMDARHNYTEITFPPPKNI